MARHNLVRSAEDEVLEVARAGGRLVDQDRFVLVFALIIGTILANTFLADQFPVGRAFTVALQTVTMLIALSTSDAGPRMRWVAGMAAGLAVVGILLAEFFGIQGLERLAYAVTMLLLGIVTPYVIARRIAKHPRITVETVSGAADIYLLIGLLFAIIFGLVGAVDSGALRHLSDVSTFEPAVAFFYSARPVNGADFMYYSFVTLTTVGYGDVTAATQLGRMLSVVEALLGQLYLVIVVALIVSNIGRDRLVGGGASSQDTAASGAPESATP
jgi:hypothetical protein